MLLLHSDHRRRRGLRRGLEQFNCRRISKETSYPLLSSTGTRITKNPADNSGHLASPMEQHQEVVLVAPRSTVSYYCSASPSPSSLFVAVQTGSVDCIRASLRRGEHIEQVNDIGLTPLLAATRSGKTAVIAALLKAVSSSVPPHRGGGGGGGLMFCLDFKRRKNDSRAFFLLSHLLLGGVAHKTTASRGGSWIQCSAVLLCAAVSSKFVKYSSGWLFAGGSSPPSHRSRGSRLPSGLVDYHVGTWATRRMCGQFAHFCPKTDVPST